MYYFFLRYAELEKTNFPIKTTENAVSLAALVIACLIHVFGLAPSPFIPFCIGSTAMFISLFTTFIATAPVIGRISIIHRWYLWLVHYPMVRVMESVEWCTGTNIHGYMMHLTAQKLLGYGYITPDEMDGVSSLAIVRNPYSRMVSIFGYNRFGNFEDFPSFVRRWYDLMRHYREQGEMEEWFTPCHCIPQFEYTHFEGKQLVQSVVKQEELKYLKTKEGAEEAIKLDNSVANLPDIVRNALLGMPRTNSRATAGKKWYEYYDQQTLDLTFKMYETDFEVFGYSPAIEQRSDLKPPQPTKKNPKSPRQLRFGAWHDGMSRNSLIDESGTRVSKSALFSSVKNSSVKTGAPKGKILAELEEIYKESFDDDLKKTM